MSLTSGPNMEHLRKKTYRREIAAGLNARANLCILIIPGLSVATNSILILRRVRSTRLEGWPQSRAEPSGPCHSRLPVSVNQNHTTGMPMPRTIDYWFSLASPWAFLGHQPFLDLAKAHDVTVRYRPVDLGEVFPHTGGLSLPQRHPARQRYRILELQRWREARGVALKINPKHWPFPAATANRTIVAVAASGADPGRYTQRAFEGVWVNDEDLGQDDTLVALLNA
ncbi:MAG: DsbA family protein, partial [Candidatus Binataceae bacterium]